MKKVQSYGAGVQSVTLLHMVLRSEIERPDLVIFADTMQEPRYVYEVVERDKALCEKAGIEFAIVSKGDLGAEWRSPKGNWMAYVPVYPVNIKTGKRGMMLRSCTDKFKIQPIRQHLRARGWKPLGVELWLGMTTDEIQRVKPSLTGWVEHRWPLIDLNMRRSDCLEYLRSIGVTAAKSACVFCPYRSAQSWVSLAKNQPEDFEMAVRYDEMIRDLRPGYRCYVHSASIPLREAVLLNQEDMSDLWGGECSGFCAA